MYLKSADLQRILRHIPFCSRNHLVPLLRSDALKRFHNGGIFPCSHLHNPYEPLVLHNKVQFLVSAPPIPFYKFQSHLQKVFQSNILSLFAQFLPVLEPFIPHNPLPDNLSAPFNFGSKLAKVIPLNKKLLWQFFSKNHYICKLFVKMV